MPAEKILLVEDGADVRRALTGLFADAGYQPFGVADGDEAMRAFYSVQPDLVLLDIRLPGLSGLDLCSRIREMSDVPIIIFSGIGDTKEKLDAFNRGADDYVVKTASLDELLARVKTGLRRAAKPVQNPETGTDVYVDAVLQVDFARCAVAVRGKAVDLTPTEFQLLAILVQNAGHPIRADQLLRRVWGPEYNTEDLVKWHIRHLRRKIEDDAEAPKLVVTRRGFGYVYVRPQGSNGV
ncbi:MAG: response regulator transcription factor [Chloroflexi bacterium]|nr:response regulator transcription factor [Chloroflexota bacterium]